MAESKQLPGLNKTHLPPLGSVGKASSALPKLPQLHGPNLKGMKPLSAPGSIRPMSSLSGQNASVSGVPIVGAASQVPMGPVDADSELENLPASAPSPIAEAVSVAPEDANEVGLSDVPEAPISYSDPTSMVESMASEEPSLPSAPQPVWESEEEDEEEGATQACAQPTAEEIAAAIAAASAAKAAQAAPMPMSAPSPVAAPAPLPNVVVPTPSGADSSIDPNANDDELQWEDEEENNGEKTMMLEVPMDDDEEADGEKTQIQMDAMDYDPLTGKFVVESGKTQQREYMLVRDKTGIGRGPKNEIVISDISISRHHISVEKYKEGFRLVDLDSANGTFLNGYRIKNAQLRDGDIIEIGNLRFRFEQNGGDPEELWKGTPVVNYHPNQNKPRSSSASAPSAPSSSPSYGSPNPMPSPTPASETMIERAGGGLAAPAWAPPPSVPVPASPLTSPYMVSYAGNMQNQTTPTWAIAVIMAAAILCFGSLVFFCVAYSHYSGLEEEQEIKAQMVKTTTEFIENGVNAYAEKRLEDARSSFRDAEKIELDGKKELIEKYMTILDQEEEINTNMINTNRTYRNKNSDELEDALNQFGKISIDSVYYMDIQTRLLPQLTSEYINKLSADVRSNIKNDNFEDARALVVKLSKLENTARKVKELNKLIDDNERRK